MTGKLEDISKSCDNGMLRYVAGERRQDRISSEEVANRCGLKMIKNNFKLRQRRLEWFGHVRSEPEGGVLRLVEQMGSRKTKENLERNSEDGFGTNRNGREQDRGRWRKIIAVRPLLEGTIWT